MSLYKRILKKLAHFQVEHPYITILLILTLSISMYGGTAKLQTVASLEEMMPTDIEEIEAFNTLRDNKLGQDMIAVVIRTDSESSDPNGVFDISDKRVYDYLKKLHSLLDKEPDVLKSYSYAKIIDSSTAQDQTLSSADYKNIINKPELDEELSDYISHDKTITTLLLRTDIGSDDARMNLLTSNIKKHIESAGKPPGVKIDLAGTPIIQQTLGEKIEHDRSSTRWISTLLVFAITMLIFFSFTSAVVPILVVTISVSWLYGTMGYTSLPISTLAGGVAAMVIGIGIDFAIHIMNKFKYERKKGRSIEESVESAVVDTGTALTASSITSMSAFLAFLTGSMPEMGRFGILMAIGIGFSLIFSLFGLPALLILEEKLLYFIKKNFNFGLEKEFSLKQEDEVRNTGGGSS